MLADDDFRSHFEDEHGVRTVSRDLRPNRAWHVELHDRDCGHEHDADDLDLAAVLKRRRVTEDASEQEPAGGVPGVREDDGKVVAVVDVGEGEAATSQSAGREGTV